MIYKYIYIYIYPSGKLTSTLAVIGVGRLFFPLKIAYVQGQQVNLPEVKIPSGYLLHSHGKIHNS